ncbi:MAG: hypothetical protein RLY32_1967, partial [Pseudomonadota bacterium]
MSSSGIERSDGYWRGVGRRFLSDRVAVAAAMVVLALVLLALFGQWMTPADPFQASMLKRLKPIGTEGFPLGTDELGRDMLS